MFLRATKRIKDGKVHYYWSMVENVRVGRRVFQRRALYLGELNDSQRKGGKSELNVVIEVKDVEKGADLHNGEAMKIRCAGVFYEMLRKDGIDVRYEKQLKNQKLADIIAQVVQKADARYEVRIEVPKDEQFKTYLPLYSAAQTWRFQFT